MVWGAAGGAGVDDLVERLQRGDPKLCSLTLLRFRRFGPPEAAALCEALHANVALTELDVSGRPLPPAAVEAVATMLARNRGLLSLCVGDSSLGMPNPVNNASHALLIPFTPAIMDCSQLFLSLRRPCPLQRRAGRRRLRRGRPRPRTGGQLHPFAPGSGAQRPHRRRRHRPVRQPTDLLAVGASSPPQCARARSTRCRRRLRTRARAGAAEGSNPRPNPGADLPASRLSWRTLPAPG